MVNWLQRAIYNLSNAVPLAVMTALAWWLEFKTWRIPVILLTVAFCVAIVFAFCFSYGKKRCSVKNINVIKIISKDSWLVAYVIAYILPFAYMVISDYHIVSLIVFVIMLALVFIPAITALPNILLFAVGYHFFELETATGVGDYILISKRRRIRKNADITKVIRIFEKLLVDTERSK